MFNVNMRPSALPALVVFLSNLGASRGLSLRRSNLHLERNLSSSNDDVLVELTRDTLPEALKSPDGSITSMKRVSSSTNGLFYNLSLMAESMLDSGSNMISHVTDAGYGEWTEDNLRTVVSKATFSCLCADLRCTKAVAADLRGVLDPSMGQHRQTSPLIMYSSTGEPLPCMSLQQPIRLDESQVKGCSLLEGDGPFGELLVDQCDEDTVSSFSLVDPSTSQTLARAMTPQELTVANIIPTELPDPRITVADLFADMNIVDPIVFRIPINEDVEVGGVTVPVDITIEYDATNALEQAGRALVVALLDEILRSLWPTDFDNSRPGSQAGQDEIMRILFRFAFYGYRQSQHALFEKKESRQLESIGRYLSIKDARPKEVSLTEVVTNSVVLMASAAGWGWSIARATKAYRVGNGLDLSTVASVAGSTVFLLGALVVFAVQWSDMEKRLNYSESMLVVETMMFSRTGTAFFGRVFRDFDIVSVATSFVNVQDVSTDYTWLFVLATLLTITAIGVAGVLGWGNIGEEFNVPRRRGVAFAICWCIILVVIPLAIGLTSNDRTEISDASQTLSPSETPVQSPMPTSKPPFASKSPSQTLNPSESPAQSPAMPSSKPIQSLEPATLPPGATEGITCKNCCKGTSACTGNKGFIGDNSCNENFACQGNEGVIEADTCNGISACSNNKGTIRSGACLANYACENINGTIGIGSCRGTSACKGNGGEIGDRSCSASFACQGNTNVIGSGSCSGTSACKSNGSVIGEDICNTNYACQS